MKMWKGALVVALFVVVVGVFVTSYRRRPPPPLATGAQTAAAAGLPRLVDLGSTTCIPCKLMAPILDELGQEYAGKLQVDFIDVNRNRQAIEQFGVRTIPTQVFLDASGKELFRHEGFFAKDDILAKWKELGVKIEAPTPMPDA